MTLKEAELTISQEARDLTSELAKTQLAMFRIAAFIGGITLIFSPIIWIWLGWSLFWKICLTSLIVHKVADFFHKGIKTTLELAVQRELDNAKTKTQEHKSNFMKKLEALQTKNK